MLSKFSHSSLGTFRQCPKKFWFCYVERVKLPHRVFAHLQLGSIVHRQLATLYQQALDGKVYSREELIASYKNDWDQLDKTKLEVVAEHMGVDDYIENGSRMLGTYYDNFQPFDQGILIMAEGNVNFQLPGTNIMFTARIDRVLKRSDGVLEICDYKTGGQALPSARDASFREQMGLYQLAIQDRYPQYEDVELVQYALKYKEAVSCRFRPDELDELTEQFRSEVNQIINAERYDDWPERESVLCRFCDYAHLCPRKRHQAALESEDDPERTSAEQAAGLVDQYLDWNDKKKEAEAELKMLRKELIVTAKDLGVSKLYSSEGYVTVSVRPATKLPTRTNNPTAFAQLVYLVREKWKLEECLTLDATALLKDFYGKGKLTDEQVGELEPHIIRKDDVRVTPRRSSPATADGQED
ncbi:MAG: PD-(D/E)XK nuclease family protein [candidate division Zixibacteria bacterium]|nr:PD-(D/E)XK nuclease family protein [candidate division Zixibacteria bacterium]